MSITLVKSIWEKSIESILATLASYWTSKKLEKFVGALLKYIFIFEPALISSLSFLLFLASSKMILSILALQTFSKPLS